VKRILPLVVAMVMALAVGGCAGAAQQPETTNTGPVTTVSRPSSTPSPTVGEDGPSFADAARATARSCLHIVHHELEVCSAYVGNASYLARVPFYKLSRSSNADVARVFRQHLEARYQDEARSQIEQQTADWPPPSQLDVYLPTIQIDSITVAANLSTATLRTHETWLVKTESGQTLLTERNQQHTITMEHVPSTVLEKWVVTEIR
jgi:hypothetical protein